MGHTWTHCPLDERFVIMRCVECPGKTARGCAETAVRHLPKPLRSGDCVGVDLETIVPTYGPGASKWVMLLAVDFKNGRVFAWDLDSAKVAVEEVQSRLVEASMNIKDPPANLRSDNGAQSTAVLEELFRDLPYCS